MTRSGSPLHTYPPGRAAAPAGSPPMDNTIQQFDSEVGVSLDGSAKVSQWDGTTALYAYGMPEPSYRPAYATDTFFNGHKVVQLTSGKWLQWQVAAGSPIFPVGSKPYVVAVLRLLTPTAGQYSPFGFSETSDEPHIATFWMLGNRYPSHRTTPAKDAQGAEGAYVRADPVLVEAYVDASGRNQLMINRSPIATGKTVSASGTTVPALRAFLGAWGGNGPIHYAFLRACSAVPPDVQRDAFYAWAKSHYALVDVPLQVPPLPLSTLASWHSEFAVQLSGADVTRWTSQGWGKPGEFVPFAAPMPGSPVHAVDGSYFNGHKVVQTGAPNKGLADRYNTGLITVGMRPWVFSVFRIRSGTGVAITIGQQEQTVQHHVGVGGDGKFYLYAADANRVTSSVSAGTTPHVVETWCDGTNANILVDGTLTTAPYTGASTQSTGSIGLGTMPEGAAYTDVSHAFHLICSSKPTDPEIAALRSWAAAYYGAS